MNKLWLLDNGHGEDTPGKRSPIYGGRQLREYEFTRDIVKRLSTMLAWAGVEHRVLVPELHDISLTERVRRANNWNSNAVYVSVHANAGRGRGIEVFTSPGQTRSDAIATQFINSFRDAFPEATFRTDIRDGDPDKEANFTVLTDTTMPAILTENFFMDNEQECKHYLMDNTGCELIALAHYLAIMNIEQKGV